MCDRRSELRSKLETHTVLRKVRNVPDIPCGPFSINLELRSRGGLPTSAAKVKKRPFGLPRKVRNVPDIRCEAVMPNRLTKLRARRGMRDVRKKIVSYRSCLLMIFLRLPCAATVSRFIVLKATRTAGESGRPCHHKTRTTRDVQDAIDGHHMPWPWCCTDAMTQGKLCQRMCSDYCALPRRIACAQKSARTVMHPTSLCALLLRLSLSAATRTDGATRIIHAKHCSQEGGGRVDLAQHQEVLHATLLQESNPMVDISSEHNR